MGDSENRYFALRFRSADDLHRKGDVQYGNDSTFFIGQTDECGLRIPTHPDYADTCYAVIARNDGASGWRLIRQEDTADITVNGVPLELVWNLHNGDMLKFDRTLVQFTEEQGERPSTQYVRSKPSWAMWAVLGCILVVLSGILLFLHWQNQKTDAIFKHEIVDICKIEADTLLVISQDDTLEVIPIERPLVGTGFITEDGYFATARHCVEFWLAMESELRPDPHDIQSLAVRRAIDAEMDTSIRLVAKLIITSHDGKHTWSHYSDEFTMDKSRDNVYECGGFATPYLWRSVVSLYEQRGAELGDAAVMRWPHGKGNIKLDAPDVPQKTKNTLYSFGYPQSDSRQEAVFSFVESNLYQVQSPDECFISEKGLDSGFSGGPVFTYDILTKRKAVVGIVSRSDGNHTLMVPVSQIHQLISKIEK